MVDLHLHTTASDGRLTPAELVDRAASVRLTVMAVTDHDTTLATADIRRLATERGIEAVSGIEITAVEDGRDVHILGYFIDDQDPDLAAFLSEQRLRRVERAAAIATRLADLGMPIDIEPLIADARHNSGRSLGRPLVAGAMVRARHVATIAEAFDKWLGQGRPAFVPREGPTCVEVIDAVGRAGGRSSLAHPGKTSVDARIPEWCAHGLDAIEAHHSDHDPLVVARYVRMATSLGVLVTGGSDFHGDPQQPRAPGSRTLPWQDWLRFQARSRAHA